MTERERMEAGLLYNSGDPDILAEQYIPRPLLDEFNRTLAHEEEKRQDLLRRMLADIGENSVILPPLYANWSGARVHIGKNVFVNFHLTLVDDGEIWIGDRVMIGPNVTISSASHPMCPELRGRGYQFNRPVRIEDNVWLSSGVIVCAGVTIGENSVIGAGSVVTRDIPANVFAAGAPCRVIRPITEEDNRAYDHGLPIDWENIP